MMNVSKGRYVQVVLNIVSGNDVVYTTDITMYG